MSSYVILSQTDQTLDIHVIGVSEGLNETNNYFCLKDSKGLIWISSLSGLYTFDGVRAKKFPHDIQGQNVNGYFVEDSASRVWFSTTEAIHCYDRKSDVVQYYKLPNANSASYFIFYLDQKDKIWFSNGDSIYTMNIHSGAFKAIAKVNSDCQRFHTYTDAEGRLKYIAYHSMQMKYMGLIVLEIKDEHVVRTIPLFNEKKHENTLIRTLYFLNDHEMYIGSSLGLYTYDMNTNILDLFQISTEDNYENILSIARLNAKELIIGSYSGKLYQFDVLEKTFTERQILYSKGKELNIPLQALYMDPDGGLWLTLPGTGLGFYKPSMSDYVKSFQVKTRHIKSDINPNSFIKVKDKIWVGSKSHGIIVMDTTGHVDDNWQRDNSMIPTIVSHQLFMDSDHRIWVISFNNSYLMNSDGEVIQKFTHSGNSFWSICETKSKKMLIGSDAPHGILEAESINGKIVFNQLENIDTNRAYTFLQTLHDGKVLGSYNLTHISILDPDDHYNQELNIPHEGRVNCLWEQNDSIVWLGTDGGINIVNRNTNNITKLSEPGCLNDINIYGIIPSDNSMLWVATNYGLHKMNVYTQSCTPYAGYNGLSELQFNAHAFANFGNGEIWLGSTSGITKFNSNDFSGLDDFSPVSITEVLINDFDPDKLGYKYYREEENGSPSYQVNYIDNTISFSFASLDYRGVEKAQYEFRLLPDDQYWIGTGNRGFARFTNLRSGDYIFQVRNAGNNPSCSAGKGPTYEILISVIPPIYQRWWFIMLSGMLLLSLLYLGHFIYQKRRRRIMELKFEKKLALEQERLRIASDLHDDLGSGLSALSLRAKFIAEQTDKSNSQGMLNQLAENANWLTQQVRETIWCISSQNDTIDNLITRIHQYSVEFFSDTDIDCTVNLPEQQIDNPIESLHRRNLFLSCKEALHNIYKHAKSHSAKVDITITDTHYLQIDISDKGKGFDASNNNMIGMGLHSMVRRMESIGGTLKITSNNSGTVVTFTYPMVNSAPFGGESEQNTR